LPYNLSVHAGTDLAFHASLRQEEFRPGAKLYLLARLSHFGIPWEADARVWAELTAPDGTSSVLELDRHDAGEYVGERATTLPGVYTFRVRAEGRTPYGWRFQREQTVTGAVFVPGAENPDPREENNRRRLTDHAKWEEEAAARRLGKK
jgi:hypothetical protein